MRPKTTPADAEFIGEHGQSQAPYLQHLEGLTSSQVTTAAQILHPVAERAQEIGLKAAISEHWQEVMTPAGSKSIGAIVPNLNNENIDTALACIQGADRGAMRALFVILAAAQGWNGEVIQ